MKPVFIAISILIGVACCSPVVQQKSGSRNGKLDVIDGKPAKITKYPYVVSISDASTLAGAGVILNENWVLTTGYVYYWLGVYSTVTNATIRAGSNKWATGGQAVGVTKAVVHPLYDGGWAYDVAVFKLDNPLQLGKNVQPIMLNTQIPLPVNTTGYALGWGVTSTTAKNPSKILRVAQNTVLDFLDCQKAYAPAYDYTFFCSTIDEKGPSTGDFGGPLVYPGDAGAVAKLYGLYAGGKVTSGSPRLYTNIPQLASWIKGIINSV